MAAVNLAAKRYAQAAFELAVAHGEVEQWAAALGQLAEFMTDVEVRNVLENTRVPRASKLNLIQAAFGELPPRPLNLAKLLVTKGRTALAEGIAQEFYVLTEELRGIVRVKATTAVALTDDERRALVARLHDTTGRDVGFGGQRKVGSGGGI